MKNQCSAPSPRLRPPSQMLLRAAFLGWLCGQAATAPGSETTPTFNRDIRPILADTCFACHGPDESKRKSGLRLDNKDDAFKPAKSGETAIVPGKPDASELIKRVLTDDADEHMPQIGRAHV